MIFANKKSRPQLSRLWTSNRMQGERVGTRRNAPPVPRFTSHRCHRHCSLLSTFPQCRMMPALSIPPPQRESEAFITIAKTGITWNGNPGPTSITGLSTSRSHMESRSGYLRPGRHATCIQCARHSAARATELAGKNIM